MRVKLKGGHISFLSVLVFYLCLADFSSSCNGAAFAIVRLARDRKALLRGECIMQGVIEELVKMERYFRLFSFSSLGDNFSVYLGDVLFFGGVFTRD